MATVTQSAKRGQDSDWVRTDHQEKVYAVVNGGGLTRNLASAAGSSLEIAKVTGVASTVLGSVVTPVTQLVTGPLCVYAAVRHTIPNALAELESANNAQEANPELHKEGVYVAKLGLVNQVFFGTMGVAVTGCGAIGMMSPAVAGTLQYAPALGASASVTASAASTIALGAIYVARGSVIVQRARYNLNYLNAFRAEFHAKLAHEGEDEALAWIQAKRHPSSSPIQRGYTDGHTLLNNDSDEECPLEQPILIGGEKEETAAVSFTRRVDMSCLKGVSSEGNPIDYLVAVDKGIFTQQLKQKLSFVIGVAMVVGGILAIAAGIFALVCLGPFAGALVTLVAAALFIIMEGAYLNFDSTKLFTKLRDYLYTAPDCISGHLNLSDRTGDNRTIDGMLGPNAPAPFDYL